MQRFDFLHGANVDYLDQLYQQYQKDPQSVDESWQAYFAGFEAAGGKAFGDGAVPSTMGLHKLVHAYRDLGHVQADLDPLGRERKSNALLDLSQFNMSESDLIASSARPTSTAKPTAPCAISAKNWKKLTVESSV